MTARSLLAALALALAPLGAEAADLPAHLDLNPPFPHVLLEAPQIEQIAPGIEYGDYELWSEIGPISVHVVAADLTNPDVRVQTVLGDDALASDGERLTSMAQRTGAVAGINGDYFDIGVSNRPTNIVVRDGTLLRTPDKRYAVAILRSGSAHFVQFSFAGSVQIGTQSIALTGVNEMPSHVSDVSLLTPSFGALPQAAGYTLVGLDPTAGTPPFATYRVLSFAQSDDGPQPAGYYLVIGTDAASSMTLPNVGDAIATQGTLSPIALTDIAAAMGGGPLILYNGDWYDDPAGPSGGEFDRRIPCSGAALESDGTLLLVEVDGRQPERSIGLTRPEFSELMRALGADDGMALDGGGSSTIVAQLPGEDVAALENSPSDGSERRIADGLLLYNAAPMGAPARVVASPQTLRAVLGAQIPLHVRAVDANLHAVQDPTPIVATVEPATLGRVDDGRFIASAAGDGVVRFREGALSGSLPVEVMETPSRIVLLPPDANVDPYGTLQLQARAFDAAGYELELPAQMHWSTSSGTIDDRGSLVAGDRDADVSLDVGGRSASTRVIVGSHDVALDVVQGVSFLTIPNGGTGDARSDMACDGCIRLEYAISQSVRAAYAIVEQSLPQRTVGISFDIQDDGSGAELRIALRNAINEQVLLSATTLDQPGRRRVVVHFPADLAQPLRLVGFYTIGTPETPDPVGSILIGNVHALVAGSP